MRGVRVAGLLVIGVALVAAVYAATTSSRAGDSKPALGAYPATEVSLDANAGDLVPAEARMLVRAVDELAPRMDGRLYEVSRSGGLRRAGSLVCKQAHASSAGPGLCMALSADGYRYEGVVFDRDYEPRSKFPIAGVPDRARVSPEGRYGAFTAFDRGSSGGYFADANGFSTDTRIVDMRSGRPALRLSKALDVRRDGKPFMPANPQFWGVTFGKGGRFYATMATDFAHFLLEGNVRARTARVIGRGIECPSLSPDGRRIAYKRRIRYTDQWRFHVRDLRTGKDVALAERRSIDDQPEWLDNERILYSDDRSVFSVPADGRGRVERLARTGTSPAVVGASSARRLARVERQRVAVRGLEIPRSGQLHAARADGRPRGP